MRDRRVYLPPDRERGRWRTEPRFENFRKRMGHSPEQLWHVFDEVLLEHATLQADGFTPAGCAVIEEKGFVWVRVTGEAGPDAAAAYFRDRYGDAVWVQWLAPGRHVERPRAFGSWTAAGRILRVFSAIDRNGERTGSATLRAETDSEIVVAVSCLIPLRPTRHLRGYKRRHHDLELRAPVGDRSVIDAATGRARRPVWEIPTH
jgi:hypothetical protein